jgi:hypothetical protein
MEPGKSTLILAFRRIQGFLISQLQVLSSIPSWTTLFIRSNQIIENIGKKPQSDGIAIDRDERVIITDVEHGAIMAFNPTTNQLSKLGGSKDIVWPDGVVIGGDGDVYFTDSSIPSYIDPLVRPPNKSKLMEHRPYFIYRLKKSRD